jgi:thiol:disulfide interchange protein DsbD
MIAEKKRDGLQWEPWSEKRMEELKGELVFIDFTAKWCLTCKVNEKLVIDTSAFKKLVDDYNVKLLLGDWTKRDPIIEAFLKKNGHVGVPVYFIQKKSGELIDLGETISIKEIESHLK